jgi:hypothetical protein
MATVDTISVACGRLAGRCQLYDTDIARLRLSLNKKLNPILSAAAYEAESTYLPLFDEGLPALHWPLSPCQPNDAEKVPRDMSDRPVLVRPCVRLNEGARLDARTVGGAHTVKPRRYVLFLPKDLGQLMMLLRHTRLTRIRIAGRGMYE